MKRTVSRAPAARRGLALASAAMAWLTVFGAAGWAAEDPPSAERILDAYVEATGGQDAYARIHNRVTRGRMEISGQHIEMSLTIWAAPPNKTYLRMDSEITGTVERGTAGDLAWENSAMMGPQIKEGAEKADMLREARFDRWPAWREVYASVEHAGTENVNDRPAHKIVATPAGGKPQTLYFDRESKLLVRHDLTIESAMGSVPVRSYYSDYRTVDGLLVPFGATTEMLNQKLTLVGESVEHNVDLAPDRFEPPAAIRQILEDRKDPVVEGAAPGP